MNDGLAYYNEIEPYAAEWLRSLIERGLIAPGHVDQRDIRDVRADDLRGYAQCHFFAGIGGWSLALRLAGWPDARPVWTGSCPCQPFSAAGKQQGERDERHLWPEFRRFVAERNPATVFGEQVASRLGREWLASVRIDMEALGYAVGAADLCAAGVGAPHIRQRLWFVADACGSRAGRDPGNAQCAAQESDRARRVDRGDIAGQSFSMCAASQLADAMHPGRPEGRPEPRDGQTAGRSGDGVEHTESEQVGLSRRAWQSGSAAPWSDLLWLPCTDGKQRPTQPGIFPLAHGVSGRVAKLRAAGNAIVPQVAAAFIRASVEEMRDAA